MGNISTKPTKPALASLKAAMVLAFPVSAGQTKVVSWWTGTVTDMAGNAAIVLQVFKDNSDNSDAPERAKKILSGHGVPIVEVVDGTHCDLLVMPVSSFREALPARVSRQWLNKLDAGPHGDWKRAVTKQLDALGIDRLKMSYSGAGDSSNEDQWQCYRSGGGMGWQPIGWNSDSRSNHWRNQDNIKLPDDLCKLISDYVWDTLCQFDCVNNDGGGGSLEINLEQDTPEFLFTCYTHETVTTTHQDEEEV